MRRAAPAMFRACRTAVAHGGDDGTMTRASIDSIDVLRQPPGILRQGTDISLGIAKDVLDELLTCMGIVVECGDDLARSALRFRRKLLRRLA